MIPVTREHIRRDELKDDCAQRDRDILGSLTTKIEVPVDFVLRQVLLVALGTELIRQSKNPFVHFR